MFQVQITLILLFLVHIFLPREHCVPLLTHNDSTPSLYLTEQSKLLAEDYTNKEFDARPDCGILSLLYGDLILRVVSL